MGFASVEPAQAQRRGGFFAQLFGTGQNTRSQPQLSANQRRINRAVQTALNFFGFDAGAVDGIMGRRSRAAVSAFQALMGYEETGRLSREESRFLLTAYNEIALKDEALSLKIKLELADPQALLTAFSIDETAVANTEAPAAPEGPPSMRSTCVNIGAAGPQDLLKAQFCNLRLLAMEQSDLMMETSLSGQSAEPVAAECRQFAAEMRPQIEQLSGTPSKEMISEMDLWVRRSGVSEEKLAGISETCLGVAYRQDNPEEALASLLVLSGLDRAIYAELTGYHLALGLGFEAPDSTLATGWMESAVAALPEGEVALTAQTSDQRLAVLADVLGILAPQE